MEFETNPYNPVARTEGCSRRQRKESNCLNRFIWWFGRLSLLWVSRRSSGCSSRLFR